MNTAAKAETWFKFGEKYSFVYGDRGFSEHPRARSRIDYNPKTGVAELYVNSMAAHPVEETASKKAVGRELKHLFGAGRYICVVTPRSKTRGKDRYPSTVEFYCKPRLKPQRMFNSRPAFRINEQGIDFEQLLPSREEMLRIPDLINKNLIFQEN